MNRKTLLQFVDFAIQSAAARPAGAVNVPAFDMPQGLLNPFATEGQSGKLPYSHAMELIPSIYSSITKRMDAVCDLPFQVLESSGKPQKRKPKNAAYLFGKANPDETGRQLIGKLVASRLWSGCGYLFWHFGTADLPQELWCLQPDRVETVRVKGSPRIDHYRCDLGNGKKQEVPAWQIVRFPRYSPRGDLDGLSPLQVAEVAYSTQRNAMLWLDQFYRKGATANGFLIVDPEHGIAIKEEERITRILRSKMQGVKNALNPVVLPRGMKFEKAGLTMREMQFLETYKLTNQDIYNIFGVPPVIMGVKEGGGLSDAGATTDLVLFYRGTIMADCSEIATIINEQVFESLIGQSWFGFGVTCRFDFSTVPVLQLEKLNLMAKATEANGGDVPFTANELRVAAGFEADPNAEHDKIPDRKSEAPPAATPEKPKKASTEGTPGHATLEHFTADATDREFLRARQDARVGAQQRIMAKGVARLGRQQEARVVDRVRQVMEPQAGSATATNGPNPKRMTAEQAERMTAAIDGEDLLQPTRADRALLRSYERRVIENAGYQELADLGMRLGFKIRGNRVERHLDSRVEIAIVGTTKTTRKLVADTLREGVRLQESTPELIARVREVFRERYYGQDTVIVRTETISAYNFGAYEAWEQANEEHPGMIEGKEWVTARDELVRGSEPSDRFSHVEAEGQVVAIGRPFVVSGESLMFPGDHAHGASAGNTIQCRCTAVPKLSPKAARVLKARKDAPTLANVTIEELLLPLLPEIVAEER